MATTDKHYKSIFVTLEEIGSASRIRSFDIVIESHGHEGETDCSRVVKAIIKNYPECVELRTKGELHFTIESLKFPGRHAELNQKAKIDDGRCIKCDVVRGVEVEKNKLTNSLDYTFSIDYNKENIEDTQTTSTVAEEVTSITQEDLVEFLNINSVGLQCEVNILRELPRNEIDCENLQGKEMPNQIDKVFTSDSPQLQYKFPTTFDQSIHPKLQHGKEKLLLNEYATLARDLSRPIISITKSPDTALIEFVVEKAMTKYPHAIIVDKLDPIPTKRLLVEKIRAICGRQRRKGGGQLSSKGGRPRKTTDSAKLTTLGPRINLTVVEGSDGDANFDWLSYEENVKKMIELSLETSSATPALLMLWKTTFPGRRAELKRNSVPHGVFPVITTRCPLLKLQQRLLDEFDMICGPETCKLFRENWLKLVPKIIDIARKPKNTKTVADILHRYHSLESSDFETRSCAAMELLPALLPTRKKRTLVDFSSTITRIR